MNSATGRPSNPSLVRAAYAAAQLKHVIRWSVAEAPRSGQVPSLPVAP